MLLIKKYFNNNVFDNKYFNSNVFNNKIFVQQPVGGLPVPECVCSCFWGIENRSDTCRAFHPWRLLPMGEVKGILMIMKLMIITPFNGGMSKNFDDYEFDDHRSHQIPAIIKSNIIGTIFCCPMIKS